MTPPSQGGYRSIKSASGSLFQFKQVIAWLALFTTSKSASTYTSGLKCHCVIRGHFVEWDNTTVRAAVNGIQRAQAQRVRHKSFVNRVTLKRLLFQLNYSQFTTLLRLAARQSQIPQHDSLTTHCFRRGAAQDIAMRGGSL
eukprot:GHVN01032379.1.p1 GENE.GHVN01032379.1~~GHVN01032379.1.p1  ORF type:complete len:141 (+),score=10.65 GHVN01032379.1:1873-2295(+)